MSSNDLIKSGCPQCGKMIGVRLDQIGRRIRCPACRFTFTFANQPPPPGPVAGLRQESVPYQDLQWPEPNTPSHSTRSVPTPESESAAPQEILWTPAEDANELAPTSVPPRQGRKAKLTARFTRSRNVVFRAVLQAIRDSRCEIASLDQENSFVKFSFTLPSGKLTEHTAFVFDSGSGAAEMDLSSLSWDDNDEFELYYQSIIREVGKYLRFAGDDEPQHSPRGKSYDEERPEAHRPRGGELAEIDLEDDWDEDDRRPSYHVRRRRRRRGRRRRSSGVQMVGLIDAVAVMYLVLSLLNFACAIFLLAGGTYLDTLLRVGWIAGFAVVIAVIIMLMGIPGFFAAHGIWNRRYWGYILGIVLAVIEGVWALGSLLQGNICGVALYGGCCAFALVVLCSPGVSEEFR